MTKVDVRYELTAPLDDAIMTAISKSHSVYGLQTVQISPKLDSLSVTYDASRLSPDDVDRALTSSGLPVRRAAV
jgi:hypothetical protein